MSVLLVLSKTVCLVQINQIDASIDYSATLILYLQHNSNNFARNCKIQTILRAPLCNHQIPVIILKPIALTILLMAIQWSIIKIFANNTSLHLNQPSVDQILVVLRIANLNSVVITHKMINVKHTSSGAYIMAQCV